MKAAGDSHRQQALFDDGCDFVETTKRGRATPISDTETLTGPNAADEPLQPQQILEEDAQWQEVEQLIEQADVIAAATKTSLPLELKPNKGSHGWLKLMMLLVLVILTVEAVLFINQLWQQPSWLQGLYGSLFSLILIGLLVILFKELRKLAQLKQVHTKQQASAQILAGERCDDIDRFCAQLLPPAVNRQLNEAKQQWQQLLDDSHSDAEVLQLYDSTVLCHCDAKAKEVIQRWSAQAALMVAISPLAALDMLLIAWRNLSMVDEIAKCYGIELGAVSRLKLIKLMLHNLLYAGASELALDIGFHVFSTELAGKLSARAGQGLGAGLMSARLGLKAMELCRPVAFTEPARQPRLKDLLPGLKSNLMAQLSQAYHA